MRTPFCCHGVAARMAVRCWPKKWGRKSGNPPRQSTMRKHCEWAIGSTGAPLENFPRAGRKPAEPSSVLRHCARAAEPRPIQTLVCPGRGPPAGESPDPSIETACAAGLEGRCRLNGFWSNDGTRTRYRSISSRLLYRMSYIWVLREGSNLHEQISGLLLYPFELPSVQSDFPRPWHTETAAPSAPEE